MVWERDKFFDNAVRRCEAWYGGIEMSEEQPEKRAIQRFWFGQLPEEKQIEYEDAMIEREFAKAHPNHPDRIRARNNWRDRQDLIDCLEALAAHDPVTVYPRTPPIFDGYGMIDIGAAPSSLSDDIHYL